MVSISCWLGSGVRVRDCRWFPCSSSHVFMSTDWQNSEWLLIMTSSYYHPPDPPAGSSRISKSSKSISFCSRGKITWTSEGVKNWLLNVSKITQRWTEFSHFQFCSWRSTYLCVWGDYSNSSCRRRRGEEIRCQLLLSVVFLHRIIHRLFNLLSLNEKLQLVLGGGGRSRFVPTFIPSESRSDASTLYRRLSSVSSW